MRIAFKYITIINEFLVFRIFIYKLMSTNNGANMRYPEQFKDLYWKGLRYELALEFESSVSKEKLVEVLNRSYAA